MRHLRFAIFYLLFAILDELRANSPPESWNLTMPIAPNLSKPRQTIGFRTAILQLVLGALLFSVGTIAIVGYINSERTLEEIRQKHFGLVSLTLSREVSRILEPAERILPELKNFTDRRSEEHTSELQSPDHLVCRLLLEKKKTAPQTANNGSLTRPLADIPTTIVIRQRNCRRTRRITRRRHKPTATRQRGETRRTR